MEIILGLGIAFAVWCGWRLYLDLRELLGGGDWEGEDE